MGNCANPTAPEHDYMQVTTKFEPGVPVFWGGFFVIWWYWPTWCPVSVIKLSNLLKIARLIHRSHARISLCWGRLVCTSVCASVCASFKQVVTAHRWLPNQRPLSIKMTSVCNILFSASFPRCLSFTALFSVFFSSLSLCVSRMSEQPHSVTVPSAFLQL